MTNEDTDTAGMAEELMARIRDVEPGSEPTETEDSAGSMFEEAAGRAFTAAASGDKGAFVSALKATIRIYQSESDL